MLSLGTVNGQGWTTSGAHDDFATVNQYVDGQNRGVQWWETTSASTLTITRPGDGAMLVTATSAGGCTTANATCYPTFGVNFGDIN